MKKYLSICFIILSSCNSIQKDRIDNDLIKSMSIDKNRGINIDDLPSDKSFLLKGTVKVQGGKSRNAQLVCDGGKFFIHFERFKDFDGAAVEVEGICHIMREEGIVGNQPLPINMKYISEPFKGLDIKKYKVLIPPPKKENKPEKEPEFLILE